MSLVLDILKRGEHRMSLNFPNVNIVCECLTCLPVLLDVA